MADSAGKVALLAGASGLVGSELLTLLLDVPDFARVYAITRRPLKHEHARLANRIVRFETLESQLKGLTCHTAFCCLGAPRRERSPQAIAGQLAYVLAFARAAQAAQAQRLVVLSCAGANVRSANAAPRVKGEIEQALEAVGVPSLDILQPGPLLGLRRETGVADLARMLAMPIVNLALVGPREQYRGIAARTVAAAMLGAARSGRRGVYRYTYAGIVSLAGPKPPTGPAQRPSSKTGQPPVSRAG